MTMIVPDRDDETRDVFCQDCKHYIIHKGGGSRSAKCRRFLRFREEYWISNNERREPRYCTSARSDREACGPAGTGWEAKPPRTPSLWQRIRERLA